MKPIRNSKNEPKGLYASLPPQNGFIMNGVKWPGFDVTLRQTI